MKFCYQKVFLNLLSKKMLSDRSVTQNVFLVKILKAISRELMCSKIRFSFCLHTFCAAIFRDAPVLLEAGQYS